MKPNLISPVLFLFFGAAVVVEAEPWTMERYIGEVLKNSPELAFSVEDVFKSQSSKMQSRAEAWLPEISFQGKTYPYGYNPDNGDEFSSWEVSSDAIAYSASVSLNLFDSFQDVRSIAVAHLDVLDAQDEVTIKRRSLIIKAMGAYLDLSLKAKRLEVISVNAQNRRELYDLTKGLYQEGLKSLYDVQKSQTDLYSAQLRLTTARYERQLATARFNLLIDQPVEQEPSISSMTEPSAMAVDELSKALEEALVNRPQVRSARRSLERKQLTLRQEAQDLWPTVSADLAGSWSDDADFGAVSSQMGEQKSDYRLGVTLSYSFGLGPWPSWQEYARARSSLRQAQEDLKETIREIREEVVMARLDLERYQKALEIARLKEALMNDSAAQTRERYRQGASGILELTQAEQDLLQSELEYADLLKDYYLAQAKYKMALGRWAD